MVPSGAPGPSAIPGRIPPDRAVTGRASLPCWRQMAERFFPYRFDKRLALMWLPFGARPGRDGVTVTDETVRATFGWLKFQTPRSNVLGGHVTGPYRWHTAVGARLSFVDDGLTFGTNRD